QIEVWISEYLPGRFVAGLRLSDVKMRQHEGRLVEREGALRPTVASAMVRLAGDGAGLLLDRNYSGAKSCLLLRTRAQRAQIHHWARAVV
ncbi:MAG TPA: hypothetical protein VJO72_07170, partial [Candidatus Dormibacteraeota bacterium]|nr:hypothetical protein [Candidatus Dormibacteraeota bacterium]